MKKFTKKWELVWKEHHFVVTNWWDFNFQGGEELMIDGQTVDCYEGRMISSRDLESTFFSAGEEHRVRVHIGSTDFGFRVGCLIFIDNILVGGDIRKKFIT